MIKNITSMLYTMTHAKVAKRMIALVCTLALVLGVVPSVPFLKEVKAEPTGTVVFDLADDLNSYDEGHTFADDSKGTAQGLEGFGGGTWTVTTMNGKGKGLQITGRENTWDGVKLKMDNFVNASAQYSLVITGQLTDGSGAVSGKTVKIATDPTTRATSNETGMFSLVHNGTLSPVKTLLETEGDDTKELNLLIHSIVITEFDVPESDYAFDLADKIKNLDLNVELDPKQIGILGTDAGGTTWKIVDHEGSKALEITDRGVGNDNDWQGIDFNFANDATNFKPDSKYALIVTGKLEAGTSGTRKIKIDQSGTKAETEFAYNVEAFRLEYDDFSPTNFRLQTENASGLGITIYSLTIVELEEEQLMLANFETALDLGFTGTGVTAITTGSPIGVTPSGNVMEVKYSSKNWGGAELYNSPHIQAGGRYKISAQIYTNDPLVIAIETPKGWLASRNYGENPATEWTTFEGIWNLTSVDAFADGGKAIRIMRTTDSAPSEDHSFYIDDFKIIELKTKTKVADQTPPGAGDSDPENLPPALDAILPGEPLLAINFANGNLSLLDSVSATTATVDKASGNANDVSKSLYVSGRTANWHAVQLNRTTLIDTLEFGKTYQFVVKGYVDDKATVPSGSETQIIIERETEESSPHSQMSKSNVPLLKGENFTIVSSFPYTKDLYPYGLRNIRFQTNGTAANVPFYIDSIEVRATGTADEDQTIDAPPFTLIDFEDGQLSGFDKRGSETVAVSDDFIDTAAGKTLKVSNRTAAWHGPSIPVTRYIRAGGTYEFSVKVRLEDGAADTRIQLSTQIGSAYPAFAGGIKTISAGEWVEFKGTHTYGSAEAASIYVETNAAGATTTFYIDDVNFQEVPNVKEIDLTLKPLKDVYSDYFTIGTIVSPSDFSDSLKISLMTHHFNAVTAENHMKPNHVRSSTPPLAFDFSAADSIVEFAKANQLEMIGHVLAWHDQTPRLLYLDSDEVENGEPLGNPLDRAEAIENLREHIREVLDHFDGDIMMWDVVNEAINDSGYNPNHPDGWKSALRRQGWYSAIGADWVEIAFRAADEFAGPDVKLYYNDYNLNQVAKSNAVRDMVVDLRSKGVRIDGIGMQGHYNLSTSPLAVETSIQKFKDIGDIEISITEFDVTVNGGTERTAPLEPQEEIAQAVKYAQMFKVFKDHADVIERVTIWGIDDPSSWRSERFPLLFDGTYAAKQAYYALLDPEAYIEEHYEEQEFPPALAATAQYGTPTIDGQIDSAWSNVQAISVAEHSTAAVGEKATAVVKTMWDDTNLYVLAQVKDNHLNKSNPAAHEQDSVEIFVDEDGARTPFYDADDGQFRVNFANDQSFGGQGAVTGFESATTIVSDGYIVEMKIPFRTIVPANNHIVGFEAQVNDANSLGERFNSANWNDKTGNSWQSTFNWGRLTLVGKPSGTSTPPPSGSGSGSGGSGSSASNSNRTPVSNAAASVANVTDTRATVTVNIPAAALRDAVNVQSDSRNIARSTLNLVMTLPERGGEAVTQFVMNIAAATVKQIREMEVDAIAISLGDIQITLPQMLMNAILSDTDTFALEVSVVDMESVSEAVADLVESGMAYNLNMYVNDKKFEDKFNSLVEVSLPYALKEGERFENLGAYYLTPQNTLEPRAGIYDRESGRISFRTISFSTYIVKERTVTFDDLKDAEWARAYVESMASKSVILGRTEDVFDPNASMTRGEFAALLVRVIGGLNNQAESSYADIAKNHVFYVPIASLEHLGLVLHERNKGRFDQAELITREEMFDLIGQVLLMKGYIAPEVDLNSMFDDSATLSSYAYATTSLLVDEGMVKGVGGRMLMPEKGLTRAEAATILYRILGV